MSWGGAVAAMISSIKNNTLAKRTKVFDKEIKAGFSNAPTYDKKVTKEEMDSKKQLFKIARRSAENENFWVFFCRFSLSFL